MATALTTLTFDFNTIRVIDRDGEPWFIAMDVCRALGMSMYAGTTQWLKGIDKAELRKVARRDLPEIFSGTAANTCNLVSESGLYKMVLRSDVPLAKPFQDWVTKEVLPSIRKTGTYISG